MSPVAQAMAPASYWSSIGYSTQGRSSADHQPSPISAVELISEMLNQEWNGIVRISANSRPRWGGRRGPGSMPMTTQKNSSPTARKCTSMNVWPRWLRIRVSKSEL